VPLMLPFQELADTIRKSTKELHSVVARYTASNEVAQLRPALSNSREASVDVAIHDTREGAQGSKKRLK
jgi:hypothetical protein